VEQLANRLSPPADKSLVISRAAGLPSPQPSPASVRGSEREGHSTILGANEPLRGLFVDALVLRENLVKVGNIPLVGRIPSLPELPPNTRVTLEMGEIDLLDLNFHARYVATVEAAA